MARCIDCYTEVLYNDTGSTPWLGVDGSETCTALEPKVRPHHIWRDEAETIYARFEHTTGKRAKHNR